MVIKQAELDIVCGITSKLPDTGMPEVAFAGKSNVGKSSLINGLMNRKSLARTSGQPGKGSSFNVRGETSINGGSRWFWLTEYRWTRT